MATSKYNPITNNTYHYNDKGEVTRIDTGKNTSSKPTINGIYTDTATSSTGRTYDVGSVDRSPTDSSGNVWYTKPGGNKVAVNPDAYPVFDDNNYFVGTKNSSLGSSDGYIDYEAQIKAMKEAQIQSRINALNSQRTSALSGLDTAQSNLAPMYYDKRNQAAAASDRGALNFAQFMASRGVQGNAGAMPEIYRNAALQGQIGALNQQELSENAAIEAQRRDINAAYESDVAAARAEAESQALQATIEQQRIDQANALEQARYNTQQATAADVTAYNRMQDTQSQYADTVNRYASNYQAEIDKVTNDNDPSNDWQIAILAAARQKKIDEANKKYQQQGYVSEDIAAALNLPVGTMTAAYKKQQQEAAAKQQVDNAMKMFAQLGYLTPEMVQILGAYGVSQDDITRMYRNQSTGGSSGGNYGLSW
jgi:hypothetical protein